MRLASHSDDESQQTVTTLFDHKQDGGSLTDDIHGLIDKIARSDSGSLGNFEGEIAQLIQSLNQQMQPYGTGEQGYKDQTQGYSTLEKSLQDIVEHIDYSNQNNAPALRTLQAKLAQMSARAASAPAETIQNNATIIHELGQRIGDLTSKVEHAEFNANNGADINALEQRINQFSDKLNAMPNPETVNGVDYDGRLEKIQSTIADMANRLDKQPEVTRHTINALEQRISEIANRLDGVVLQSDTSPQILDLENRVRALDDALRNTQNAGQDQAFLKNFEAQISELLQRLSTVEQRFEKLQTVENSIAQLFDAVEQNRAWREQANQQFSEQQNLSAQIAALNAMEEKFHAIQASTQSNDPGTKQTLDGVNKTIEELTRRLNRLEGTGPANQGKQSPPPLPKDPPQSISAQKQTPAQDQVAELARMLAGSIEKNTTTSTASQNKSPETDRLDQAAKPQLPTDEPPTPQSANSAAPEDFIAAARRAAQMAATIAPENTNKSPFELSRKFSKTSDAKANENNASNGKLRKRKALLLITCVLLAISAVSAYTFIGNKSGKPVAVAPINQAAPATKQAAPFKKSPRTRAPKPSGARQKQKRSSTNLQTDPAKTGSRINTSQAPVYSPIQTGSLQPQSQNPAGQQRRARAQTANKAPISSVGPRMGHSYSLLDPTGNWSVSNIVKSMHARRAGNTVSKNAQTVHTGSLPSKSDAAAKPAASPGLNTRRLAALSKATDPLPPESIGPQSLRMAAAAGNMAAQFEVAVRYSDGKLVTRDYGKAVAWYQKAAAQGLAPAQYRLGTFYEKGRGVPLDKAAARIWYERAAEKGNIKAMHNLAVIYANGDGAKPVFTKAALWFRKAAELGLTDSQYNLGVLNERGLGMPKDVVEAYKWFSIAARSGDKEAKKRKTRLEKVLTPQMLVKAKLAAQTWQASPAVAIANEVAPPEGGWEVISNVRPFTALTNRQMVSQAQILLNKLGFQAGPSDGIMGQKTRDAIRNFQTGNGMKSTGEVSPGLIQRLRTVSG